MDDIGDLDYDEHYDGGGYEGRYDGSDDDSDHVPDTLGGESAKPCDVELERDPTFLACELHAISHGRAPLRARMEEVLRAALARRFDLDGADELDIFSYVVESGHPQRLYDIDGGGDTPREKAEGELFQYLYIKIDNARNSDSLGFDEGEGEFTEGTRRLWEPVFDGLMRECNSAEARYKAIADTEAAAAIAARAAAAAKAKAARKRKNDKERRRAVAAAMGDDDDKENSAKSGLPDGALSKARTSTCVNHDASYTAEPSAGSGVPDAEAAVTTAFGGFGFGSTLC